MILNSFIQFMFIRNIMLHVELRICIGVLSPSVPSVIYFTLTVFIECSCSLWHVSLKSARNNIMFVFFPFMVTIPVIGF